MTLICPPLLTLLYCQGSCIKALCLTGGSVRAGIAVSNDPVLQTRVLAYADTQRYRLGVNYQLLPVSRLT